MELNNMLTASILSIVVTSLITIGASLASDTIDLVNKIIDKQ
jgi:hypothetical protein